MNEYASDSNVYVAPDSRVYLRLLSRADVGPEYIEWFRDGIVTEFLDSKDLTEEAIINYIEEGIKTKNHYMYGIFDVASNAHIGNLKVGPIQWRHKVADLVCVIGRRDFWGKGLAKDAIRIGNKIAFERYGIRKLSGGIASENVGSIKAYTGAGWVVEGTLKGHHLINGSPQDRVVVSCFNPEFFEKT